MYQGLGIFGIGGKKKPSVSRDEAKRVVQSIYQELLLRDPWDPYDPGAEGFVNCLVEGWCDTDFVRTGVIQSPEYADKELARARAVYGSSPGSAPSSAAAAAPFSAGGFMGGIPSSVGGVPITYIIGGLVLLMLLKKR